jgi:hypothetical protein
MNRSRIMLVAAFLALSGCGRVADLEPAPGHPMPIKPMMARTTPTVSELLTPPTYARPDRIDELMKKSQPRPSDPFDLPAPSGGAAPALPAGTDPQPVDKDTGPATPGG